MAFTDSEIASNLEVIESVFWSRRRPPIHLRNDVREGQRFTGQAIELFIVRPAFQRPGEFTEESIAKVRYIRTSCVWEIYWKRADLQWHRYPPIPQADSLAEALRIIDDDLKCCFFG